MNQCVLMARVVLIERSDVSCFKNTQVPLVGSIQSAPCPPSLALHNSPLNNRHRRETRARVRSEGSHTRNKRRTQRVTVTNSLSPHCSVQVCSSGTLLHRKHTISLKHTGGRRCTVNIWLARPAGQSQQALRTPGRCRFGFGQAIGRRGVARLAG